MSSSTLTKGFQTDAFNSTVEEAVDKRVREPLSVDAFAAKLADAPSITVLVANFVVDKVEKNTLDKTKMEN